MGAIERLRAGIAMLPLGGGWLFFQGDDFQIRKFHESEFVFRGSDPGPAASGIGIQQLNNLAGGVNVRWGFGDQRVRLLIVK